MVKIDLSSSNMCSIEHNNDNKLKVEFKNGAIYEYENVDKLLFKEIEKQESPGKFFYKTVIKNPNLYPYKLIKERFNKK